MVPIAAVVSGPGSRVTLTSGVSGPGQHKRTQIRIESTETIEGRPRVLHTIHIVDLSMRRGARREPRLFYSVHDILWNRPCRRIEDGWFVHIVPETLHALTGSLFGTPRSQLIRSC